MEKYLVIAHFDGDHTPVKNAIRKLAQGGDATFHLIVPATPPPTPGWTWTESEAVEAAQQRLNSMLADYKETGANITGAVVNFSALAAAEEAVQTDTYDELLIGTGPEPDARPTFLEYEQAIHRVSDIPLRHIHRRRIQARRPRIILQNIFSGIIGIGELG